MRRFLVRFIRPESFVHTRSSAGFTITTSEFKFSVHRVSYQIKLAFRNPMGVEDGRGGVEPVGKQERGALVLHGPSAIRQQGAGVIVHGDIHDDNRALAAFDAFEVLQYLRNKEGGFPRPACAD